MDGDELRSEKAKSHFQTHPLHSGHVHFATLPPYVVLEGVLDDYYTCVDVLVMTQNTRYVVGTFPQCIIYGVTLGSDQNPNFTNCFDVLWIGAGAEIFTERAKQISCLSRSKPENNYCGR